MNAAEVESVFGTLSSMASAEKKSNWGPVILLLAVVGIAIYVSSIDGNSSYTLKSYDVKNA